MSPDPDSGSYAFANPQSLDRYSYVMNNPMTFSDPSGELSLPGALGGLGAGLFCEPECGIAISAAEGIFDLGRLLG